MLLRWKMDLPDDLLTSTPRLIVLYAWALGLACQLDVAEELANQLSRFLPAPSATAQKSMLAQWLALSGIIARGRGDSDKTQRYCTEALLSLPERRYGQRLVCLSTLANLAVANGDLWRARVLNRDALELAQRVANPLFEALAHYDRARVLQARGEILRALEEVRQGQQRLKGLSTVRLYAVRARLTLYEGYLLTLRLQVDEGRVLLLAGLAEARACRDISVLIGHCVIATMEGCAGRFAEAFAELAEAERLMHIWDVPPIYYLAMITLVKCELWLLQGRMDLADAWLLRLTQTYNGGLGAAAPECHPQLPQHIELQRAVLERLQGDGLACEQRLQALERRAQEVGAKLLGLIAMTQQIGLLLSQARRDEARALLLRSLPAASGGALIPFKALIGEHPRWLHEQLLHLPPCRVQAALLEKLPACCTPSPEPAHGGDCLSVRELGVLQLIAQGCSNQEISEQLFISLHTVKTHASHINSKLGVERRTQAVARAKTLGLLA
ncbi:ATP-dependent transcriptional regulator, LuxR family [Pseudomonas syringae pv. pisi]|nr:ATP-dependent transcriptional regulator, LuxR family [Pseudomonas syringae pv. pisi]